MIITATGERSITPRARARKVTISAADRSRLSLSHLSTVRAPLLLTRPEYMCCALNSNYNSAIF